MVVLLVGGSGSLMDMLIHKLNKDRHRVYVLTGSRHSGYEYPHVFEKFDFSYDSDSIGEIFASAEPDVTIFLGACDTNFSWRDARKDAVRYMAGLSNVLSAYALHGKGRFIYLSSHEVFGRGSEKNITEDMPVSANNFRAMALFQGEELCRSYKDTNGIDTVVIRYDHLYGPPKKGEPAKDLCSEMMLEALTKKRILANDRYTYAMLYISDAVEFTYQIIKAEKTKYALYHLSSGEAVTQMDIARFVKKSMKGSVEIENHSIGESYRQVLDTARYAKEFNYKIFVSCEEGVRKTAVYMEKNRRAFLRKESAATEHKTGRTLWTILRLLIPYVENLICFIPFFMLNNRAVSSAYYNKLDFLLLYVLLFAIIYGQQQAVFSSVLAVIGYCFRQMYDKSSFDVFMDYSTYIWIAQLFILGMAVGYMRDRIRYIKEEDEEKIGYLNGQLSDMTDINDSNVRMKHNFEHQLINQKDSLGKIYAITSKLEQYAPEEVLFYAAQVLSNLMDTPDAAIYTVANGDYARLFSFTSDTARGLGNSIKYTDMKEMYSELTAHRVYINRSLDGRYPLMAAAIYSENKMQIIMMLWGIPWERMNLSESNRLMIVGQLVQNATVRASRYLEALRSERYVEDTNILEKGAFTRLAEAFSEAKDRGLTECSLLKIETPDESFREAGRVLAGVLRQSDYLGILEDGLHVLLPNTDEANAGGVVSRFEEKGFESRVVHFGGKQNES